MKYLLGNGNDKFFWARKNPAWFPAGETRAEYNRRSRFATQHILSTHYRTRRFHLLPASNARTCSKKSRPIKLPFTDNRAHSFVSYSAYLSSFHLLRGHNDHPSVLLVDHVPKIPDGVRKAALRCYVVFAQWCRFTAATGANSGGARSVTFLVLQKDLTMYLIKVNIK